mmetsp:Transcript_63465/g.175933  ORF Transcript_63465/g.175933 Transcript_63465/m.175933 type:complete len:322 (-) Transcript_63465:378-1343(-)
MAEEAALSRRARMQRERVRRQLEAVVLTSQHDLAEEAVIVLELNIRYYYVFQDFGDERLKLKFRMNNFTYWKSETKKILMNGNRQLRTDLNIAVCAVFEGGSALEFDLCKPGFMGSSAVASCRVPLNKALGSMANGSTEARAWFLELWSKINPSKALGSLAVGVCARTSKLGVVGGAKALKAVTIPKPPADFDAHSGLGLIEDVKAGNAFAAQVAAARWHLQEAFAAAMAAVLPPESGAESPFEMLVALPELTKDMKARSKVWPLPRRALGTIAESSREMSEDMRDKWHDDPQNPLERAGERIFEWAGGLRPMLGVATHHA